jgi:hypothetical protein
MPAIHISLAFFCAHSRGSLDSACIMSTHAKGHFTVTSWKEKPYKEFGDGPKLTRASVAQSFEGPIEGEGTTEYVMAHRRDGTATFVGITHVQGRIGGHEGHFVLQTMGSFDGTTARGTWTVAPGLGGGSLKELNGVGGFEAPMGPEGIYALDYNINVPSITRQPELVEV